MLKSPLQYPGAKSRLLDKMIPYFLNRETFVDLFVGGGSVFLCKSYAKYIINDIDVGVYDLWRIILESSNEEFIELLKGIIESVSTVANLEQAKSVENGLNTILTNYWSFGGNLSSTSRAVVGKDRTTEMKRRWERRKDPLCNKIVSIRQNFRGRVVVYNKDYADVPIPSNSIIYADPPYVEQGERLYRYCDFDHERFASWIKVQTNPWVLSYDDCDVVRGLFEGHAIKAWGEASRSTDNNSFVKPEVLIFSKNHPMANDIGVGQMVLPTRRQKVTAIQLPFE